MQPITSMLRRTTDHVSRQSELFASRARKATGTLAGETRSASRDLASAVRAEANAWSKYVRETAATATGTLAPHALERSVLLRTSLALRALDARLRRRLDSISGSKRRTKAKHVNGTSAKARTKRHAIAARAN